MRKIYYLSKSLDLGQHSIVGHAVIQNCLSDNDQFSIDLFFSSSVIPSKVRLFLYSQTIDLEIPLSRNPDTRKNCLSGYFPVVSEYRFELILPDAKLQFGTKPILKTISQKSFNTPVPTHDMNIQSENNYRNSDNIISQNSISLWDKLKNRFGCSTYFSDHYEGISLTPSEIHRFTIQDQSLEENSFLLHGYYQYKHILLLRSNSSKQDPSYYIGVPGIWQKQEKIVAGMFGFSSFKAMHFSTEKKVIHQTVPPSGTFGYYLREIQFVDCCK